MCITDIVFICFFCQGKSILFRQLIFSKLKSHNGFLSNQQNMVAYLAHPAAIFCHVFFCPQKVIIVFQFISYFWNPLIKYVDTKPVSNIRKTFWGIPWPHGHTVHSVISPDWNLKEWALLIHKKKTKQKYSLNSWEGFFKSGFDFFGLNALIWSGIRTSPIGILFKSASRSVQVLIQVDKRNYVKNPSQEFKKFCLWFPRIPKKPRRKN